MSVEGGRSDVQGGISFRIERGEDRANLSGGGRLRVVAHLGAVEALPGLVIICLPVKLERTEGLTGYGSGAAWRGRRAGWGSGDDLTTEGGPNLGFSRGIPPACAHLVADIDVPRRREHAEKRLLAVFVDVSWGSFFGSSGGASSAMVHDSCECRMRRRGVMSLPSARAPPHLAAIGSTDLESLIWAPGSRFEMTRIRSIPAVPETRSNTPLRSIKTFWRVETRSGRRPRHIARRVAPTRTANRHGTP